LLRCESLEPPISRSGQKLTHALQQTDAGSNDFYSIDIFLVATFSITSNKMRATQRTQFT
jgi:hypothetical protein